MKEFESYIKVWRERFKQESILAIKRKNEARIAAERMASVLIEKYKAKEVYLVGSVIIPDKEFSINSDIDLGVSGISPEDYYRIWKDIEALSKFKVDLIDLDRCSQEFRQKVLAEGRRFQIEEKPISPFN